MPLYGNELDRDTNPFEAGLGRVVKLDKAGDFVGRAALEKRRGTRPAKQLVGMKSRPAGAIARHGYPDPWPTGSDETTRRRHQRRALADAGRAHRDGATSRPTTATSVPWSTSRSARRRSTPRSSRYRSTSAPVDAATVRPPNAAARQRIREQPSVQVPDDLRYTHDHEWLRVEGDEAVIGITEYAAERAGRRRVRRAAGPGMTLEAAQSFGVIESVKTASDLYAPAAGEVIAINAALAEQPELVNDDPYGEGWMIRVRLGDAAADRGTASG